MRPFADIEAAIEHDTALEINANYYRLDLRDTHVRAAVEAGARAGYPLTFTTEREE